MADDPNSPAARQQMMRRVYWKNAPDGHPGYVDMYAVDAANAVRQHGDEYSLEPLGDEPAPPSAGVPIPVAWRDNSTAQRRALAQELGAPADVLPADADKFIADQEKRRSDVQTAAAEQAEARAAKQPAGPVDIPKDWETQTVPQRRALARKLGADNKVTADQADARIREELARRSGGVADPTGKGSEQK